MPPKPAGQRDLQREGRIAAALVGLDPADLFACVRTDRGISHRRHVCWWLIHGHERRMARVCTYDHLAVMSSTSARYVGRILRVLKPFPGAKEAAWLAERYINLVEQAAGNKPRAVPMGVSDAVFTLVWKSIDRPDHAERVQKRSWAARRRP
jgi:hypothetical protein